MKARFVYIILTNYINLETEKNYVEIWQQRIYPSLVKKFVALEHSQVLFSVLKFVIMGLGGFVTTPYFGQTTLFAYRKLSSYKT